MVKTGKCPICKLVGLLLIVGAVNAGLTGVFGLDLISRVLGGMPTVEKVVYALIGLSGVAALLMCVKRCPCDKTCDKPNKT